MATESTPHRANHETDLDLRESRVGSRHLVDGVLLQVYRDEVRLPDGSHSVREWIDHPGASAVVPLFEDGTTILLRQFRYPARRVFLEIPAGKFDDPGEDPAALAARELEEETGWKAGRLTELGMAYPCIGYSNERIHFYLAEELTPGTAEPDEHEFVDPFRLPFEEAVRMARSGELLDIKTVHGLVRAWAYLERRAAEAGL